MSEQEERRETAHVAEPKKQSRVGLVVFVILAVLTGVEYLLAVSIDANLPILMVVAIAKAVLIMYYFMHVARSWGSSEEES